MSSSKVKKAASTGLGFAEAIDSLHACCRSVATCADVRRIVWFEGLATTGAEIPEHAAEGRPDVRSLAPGSDSAAQVQQTLPSQALLMPPW